MNEQQLIEDVVREVVNRLGAGSPGANGGSSTAARSTPASRGGGGSTGRFASVDQAVEAASRAQGRLVAAGVEVRREICHLLKRMARENAAEWGRIELEETGIGRLDHKVAKLELLSNVPGVEFLETAAHSGDEGLSVDEAAPWGVIGAITPATHSVPTLTANAINMIAAGNAVIANPHPAAAGCAAMAVEAYNRAIEQAFGISPLICVMDPPTLDTAEEIFTHEGIPLLVVTGGPMVAQAALEQPKRAIVAGPGNPPVVVDESADLDQAAAAIISGGAFDNNLLCIGEKEVFVVDSVFEPMLAAMRRAGAGELDSGQIDRLTKAAFKYEKDHYAVQKELVGKDPSVLAEAAGASVGPDVELLFGVTDEGSPFVAEEQMMPFVPFVRCRDFDHAMAQAIKYEHGFGHTAIIHSNNLAHITEMGRAVNTTIYVVNGPCTAGLGVGGEGYPSYSIATPTGEGITNPMTFTRFRRAGVAGSMRFV